MKLSGVDYVILGLLHGRPGSGYDLKARVDRSTRFFYAASYGQIYPELRRLAAAGLVAGEAAPTRERRRTVYRLTRAGERALREWLRAPDGAFELRDEGLLKVFFSSALPADEAAAKLQAMRERHARELERLRAVQAEARDVPRSRLVALDFGVGFHAWAVEWCERTERRLRREARTGGGA